MKKTVFTLMMLLVATFIYAKDVKTLVVTTTPQMHCENCENKIKGNLRFEKGIKKIETSIDAQKVTIEYDADKTCETDILKAFGKFGYEATNVDPAQPAAGQPQGCCGQAEAKHDCGGCGQQAEKQECGNCEKHAQTHECGEGEKCKGKE